MSLPSPVFAGLVDPRGKLTLDRQSDFVRYVRTFAGKPVELVIRRPRKHRSDRQHRYYFGVVVAILAEHLGYTSDEMHDALKGKFLCEDPDAKLPRIRSTTSLSTVEFEAFLEQIRTFASTDFNCYIPLPNEVEVPA